VKKNAINRLAALGDAKSSRRKLRIFPKLMCLLLAIVIWLTAVNFRDHFRDDSGENDGAPDTEQTA
jgi:hypothetical protein